MMMTSILHVLLLAQNGKIFHKCGDMQTSMGTNFGDAPTRLKPFNEHDLAIQHAFAHIISTWTGCPSVFFPCGFGQVYRNEFESRRCCYYYRVIIIIILLSSVGGQTNNNNTIIIITHSMVVRYPPRTCGRRGVKKNRQTSDTTCAWRHVPRHYIYGSMHTLCMSDDMGCIPHACHDEIRS